MVAPNPPSRFPLGRLVSTPGALEAIEEAGQTPLQFVMRHQHGHWGTVCPEDAQENEQAIIHGDRILSAYELTTGVKIYVITEGDRSATTILLSEEY